MSSSSSQPARRSDGRAFGEMRPPSLQVIAEDSVIFGLGEAQVLCKAFGPGAPMSRMKRDPAGLTVDVELVISGGPATALPASKQESDKS